MKHYSIIKDKRFNMELICSIPSINFLNDLHIYNILYALEMTRILLKLQIVHS